MSFNPNSLSLFNQLSLLLCTALVIMTSCNTDDSDAEPPVDNSTINPPIQISADINNDGKLNILVIGTSVSIKNNTGGFASNTVATELDNILSQDASIDLEVNIVFEDIYKEKMVTFGLGQAGNTFVDNHYCHSLMQYYYWPENQTERLDNLASQAAFKWDYVVIGADPYIVAKLPGYYALGVNKIAKKVADGGAKPLLLMLWPKDVTTTASINHFSEYTYRTADGAKTTIQTVTAGKAWEALPASKKDTDLAHPSPNGAYLTAAAIYTQILNKNATTSNYQYDDLIADIVLETKNNEANSTHYTGERTFISPFKSCGIDDSILNYNHTGTSSENGILNGLQWIIGQSDRTLVSNGTPPINFNYGRANTNFEPNKRYNIDPAQFDFSLGFPMQDNGNHGNTSMLYGLDKRINETENGTDLGTALYMVRNAELPYARAIPIRTLYAQLKEAIPSQSAYSDNWHMHGNLDKAIGAFMYTLLTGDCVLGEEPTDQNSDDWKTWTANKIGYETAYSLMHLKGNVPVCN